MRGLADACVLYVYEAVLPESFGSHLAPLPRGESAAFQEGVGGAQPSQSFGGWYAMLPGCLTYLNGGVPLAILHQFPHSLLSGT